MAYKPILIGKISTSEKELINLIKSWLAISFAFAVVLSPSIFTQEFYSQFIIASLTVGIGFLLHELGHKVVAQRYGCFAEFRSFDQMLLLAVLMSFAGFVFAAPGAVMISGRINTKKNGIISAAGPIVNLCLAVIFLAMLSLNLGGIFQSIATYGFMVNTWLALFNMIPFWMFDGAKILRWSKSIYFGIVAIGLFFYFARNFI